MQTCNEHDSMIVVYSPTRRFSYRCPMCIVLKEMAKLELDMNELQHDIAECASKCGISHDNDFISQETLNRIAQFYNDK